MSTINISLPEEQIDQVDKTVDKYGFANRSEFIRSLLRFVLRKPDLLNQAIDYPFMSPTEKSLDKIVTAFEKTKKYSPEFIRDLKEGLDSSDYFKK